MDTRGNASCCLAAARWASESELPPLPKALLAAIHPEDFADLRLLISPSAELIKLSQQVGSLLLRQNYKIDDSMLPEAAPEVVLIFKAASRVQLLTLSKFSARAFATLAAGETLGRATHAAAEISGLSEQAAIETITKSLGQWLDLGLVRGLSVAGCESPAAQKSRKHRRYQEPGGVEL